MAKGNNGNCLQHGLETAVAVELKRKDRCGRLHVAITHGMAPFEPFDPPSKFVLRDLLEEALRRSGGLPASGEAAIVTAYRNTEATGDRYPNTAELLRSLVGRQRMSGGMTEKDPGKCQELKQAWQGSSLHVACTSWRGQLEPGGVLACPEKLDRPWMFTMDPMVWTKGKYSDDDRLHDEDIERLCGVLKGYIASAYPGAATIFSFSMKAKQREGFRKFVRKIKEEARFDELSLFMAWHQDKGRRKNLGALLQNRWNRPSSFRLPEGVREDDGT